ncbi:CYTH and CHAD domain-containing protein [Piscinibacter sp. XHJ-5]|uniref:CYTH and CHAD domain-containing protein n=1 Tax=Piscinibacter sp. XHJ-5 TaxID=3037797 RepID=UPI0024528CA6|nr:CYTH and CHAD domain-containing protein [Piscinibacter sp. XHJ-5]
MSELELKFEVPPQHRESLASQLRTHGARTVLLRARYFDTPDGVLSKNGVSLRLRNEEGQWIQTLKSPGAGAGDRFEHSVARTSVDGELPALQPSLHDGSPAAKAFRECLGDTEIALVERITTDVSRLAVTGQRDGTTLEVALDTGAVRAGGRQLPVCELELELKSGEPAVLWEVAREWALPQGLWLSTLAKAQRGTHLADGAKHGPAVKAATPRLSRQMGGEALVRAVVRSCLDQMLGNASEVAAGSTQEEHIHQLRIGLRRLRTALRELGPLATGIDAAWQAPLVEAFRRLGELRDDDTVARAVRPLLEEAGAPSVEWPRPDVAVDTTAIVRNSAFQAVLLHVIGFAHDKSQGGLNDRSTRQYVIERLRKLHRRVAREGRRFDKLDTDAQHRVRKQLKRLRYLSEFVADLFGIKRVEQYLEHLRPAQDALGAHNDAVIALEKFRNAARSDSEALFAVGWLQSHLRSSARRCKKALAKAADAPRFWK